MLLLCRGSMFALIVEKLMSLDVVFADFYVLKNVENIQIYASGGFSQIDIAP